jgi:uncharacterized glyoxalase superfamily protein PhnB
MRESAHPNIFPTLRYRDASAAIDWLQKAFGFEPKAVYRGEDGTVQHAELRFGAGMIMLGEVAQDDSTRGAPPDPAGSNGGIYIVVDDADVHHDRASAAGAEIVRAPTDQDYGSRDYSARDPEGNLWSFGTYDPYAVE